MEKESYCVLAGGYYVPVCLVQFYSKSSTDFLMLFSDNIEQQLKIEMAPYCSVMFHTIFTQRCELQQLLRNTKRESMC